MSGYGVYLWLFVIAAKQESSVPGLWRLPETPAFAGVTSDALANCPLIFEPDY